MWKRTTCSNPVSFSIRCAACSVEQMCTAGVYFRYTFAPLEVRLSVTRRTVLQLITSLCAVIGGVFTTAGLVYSFVGRAIALVKQAVD